MILGMVEAQMKKFQVKELCSRSLRLFRVFTNQHCQHLPPVSSWISSPSAPRGRIRRQNRVDMHTRQQERKDRPDTKADRQPVCMVAVFGVFIKVEGKGRART